MRRDVYSGRLKLDGEEHEESLRAANNYAISLLSLRRFKEAKKWLRKSVPVARRVFGESNDLTLRMIQNYAAALCNDEGATLADVREAVATLEDVPRNARRVLGGAHPTTKGLEISMQMARAALRAREGDDVSSVCDAVEKMTPGHA